MLGEEAHEAFFEVEDVIPAHRVARGCKSSDGIKKGDEAEIGATPSSMADHDHCNDHREPKNHLGGWGYKGSW